EDFADYFCQRLAQQTIAHDYPAKGRLLVSGKRLVPSLTKIRIRADPARVGMLEDCDGRFFEFGDQIRRRADVENVVEGEFFPVKFFEVFVEITVERAALVRIFSVTQPH